MGCCFAIDDETSLSSCFESVVCEKSRRILEKPPRFIVSTLSATENGASGITSEPSELESTLNSIPSLSRKYVKS